MRSECRAKVSSGHFCGFHCDAVYKHWLVQLKRGGPGSMYFKDPCERFAAENGRHIPGIRNVN